MKFILVFTISLLSFTSFSQIIGGNGYNQVSKLSIGYSNEHLDHYILKNGINDTGNVSLNFKGWSPSISYTHEFVFGDILSLCGNLGYQYMNLTYGNQKYGGSFMYFSAAPKVTLVHRLNFEYYMKLKVGGVIYFHEPDLIPEPARRFLPDKANIFTGVTLVGLDFLLANNLGLNVEVSVWSPEFITAGISYRFYGKELKGLKGK